MRASASGQFADYVLRSSPGATINLFWGFGTADIGEGIGCDAWEAMESTQFPERVRGEGHLGAANEAAGTED